MATRARRSTSKRRTEAEEADRTPFDEGIDNGQPPWNDGEEPEPPRRQRSRRQSAPPEDPPPPTDEDERRYEDNDTTYEDLAPSETGTDLAPRPSNPLAAYDSEPEFENDDILIPRLRLAQALTREVIDNEATQGQFVLTGFDAVETVTLVPVAFGRMRTLRDSEDMVICESSDAITGHGDPGGDCRRCPEARWTSGRGREPAAGVYADIQLPMRQRNARRRANPLGPFALGYARCQAAQHPGSEKANAKLRCRTVEPACREPPRPAVFSPELLRGTAYRRTDRTSEKGVRRGVLRCYPRTR